MLMPRNKRIRSIQCFLLDMDGTFYLGNQLFPGAKEFLAILRKDRIPFYFLTNNSSKNRWQYAKKLHFLGLHVTPDQILTSGLATAHYLKIHHPGKKITCFGTAGLKKEMRSQGIRLTDSDPDVVVLGFDTTTNYSKLWRLCDLVHSGLPFIATHPDINCPVENGFQPDTGSFLALIEASTGRKPDVIIGKPHKHILDALACLTGVDSRDTAIVGDRLYTDMALGKHGVYTILVLSGETKRKDLAASKIKPDLVLQNIQELVELIK